MRNRGILCSIIIFSVCGLFQGDSAPFPSSCRCQQNDGVKQKFVVDLGCRLSPWGLSFLSPRPARPFRRPCYARRPVRHVSVFHPFPVLRVPSRSQGLAAVLHPVLMGSPPVPGFVATFRLAGCVRRLSPVGKVRLPNS